MRLLVSRRRLWLLDLLLLMYRLLLLDLLLLVNRLFLLLLELRPRADLFLLLLLLDLRLLVRRLLLLLLELLRLGLEPRLRFAGRFLLVMELRLLAGRWRLHRLEATGAGLALVHRRGLSVVLVSDGSLRRQWGSALRADLERRDSGGRASLEDRRRRHMRRAGTIG